MNKPLSSEQLKEPPIIDVEGHQRLSGAASTSDHAGAAGPSPEDAHKEAAEDLRPGPSDDDIDPKPYFFDHPEHHDEFANMAASSGPPGTIDVLRRIHQGLNSIQTLSKIQAGFVTEEGFEDHSNRLSLNGQDNLAHAIALLSEYMAGEIFEVANSLKSKPMKDSL